MKEVKNQTIKDIYKSLGPFDHYQDREVDEELDTQR